MDHCGCCCCSSRSRRAIHLPNRGHSARIVDNPMPPARKGPSTRFSFHDDCQANHGRPPSRFFSQSWPGENSRSSADTHVLRTLGPPSRSCPRTVATGWLRSINGALFDHAGDQPVAAAFDPSSGSEVQEVARSGRSRHSSRHAEHSTTTVFCHSPRRSIAANSCPIWSSISDTLPA